MGVEAINEISNIISNVGVPVAAAYCMAKYIKVLHDDDREDSKALSKSLNDLSIKIQQLIDKLDRGNTDGE